MSYVSPHLKMVIFTSADYNTSSGNDAKSRTDIGVTFSHRKTVNQIWYVARFFYYTFCY